MISGLIYDRTAEDVAAKTVKGRYQYSDMNRVQNAVTTIRGRFTDAGYYIPAITLTSWAVNNIPRRAKAGRYLSAVQSLSGLVPVTGEPVLPASMDRLDYNGANNIEKFLFLLDGTMDNIEASWWLCGELFAGEVDM